MMVVRIHFHGAIDRRGIEQDHELLVEPGTTVGQVLARLGYSASQARFIVPMVAGQRVHAQHALSDRDQLDLLAPAGGG